MYPSDLPFDASCVVVWLNPGIVPTGADFSPANAQTPPNPNPAAYWFYHEALIEVMDADRSHGKVPWIKFGTNVLDQDKIKSEHARLMGSPTVAKPAPASALPPAGEGEV